LNILHIVGGELTEGAARGAYWLHQGLKELGVASKILTNSKNTLGDDSVISTTQNNKNKLFSLIRSQLDVLSAGFYKNRKKVIFSTGFLGFNFTKTKAYQDADIIHLHWINDGFVNIKNLGKIDKPLIWTMRDMWPMTGGCHYSIGCEGYITGCGKCPQLGSRHALDLSWLILQRKRRHMPKSTKIVGVSRWLSDCARKSILFQSFDVRMIHNNVNTQDFIPVQKSLARQILALPLEKSIILSGAHNLEDYYKGFNDYLDAARQLTSDPLLLFFGKLSTGLLDILNKDYVSFGFLHDIVSLRLAYSAADVFVAPSHMDAFGKTLAEAMACGTPVVCFDTTGPKDIVDHKINGYKAKLSDGADMARGIEWVLAESTKRQPSYVKQMNEADLSFLPPIGRKAREKVVREFDSKVIAKRYLELYNDVLAAGRLEAASV
jgi:glycosyltransferase involved in cell wall biosynthesis